jgi:hypothetical protein
MCENKEKIYTKSEEYWATQPATVNGMLGGYEHISDVDIEQSQQFLSYFLYNKVIYRLYILETYMRTNFFELSCMLRTKMDTNRNIFLSKLVLRRIFSNNNFLLLSK